VLFNNWRWRLCIRVPRAARLREDVDRVDVLAVEVHPDPGVVDLVPGGLLAERLRGGRAAREAPPLLRTPRPRGGEAPSCLNHNEAIDPRIACNLRYNTSIRFEYHSDLHKL